MKKEKVTTRTTTKTGKFLAVRSDGTIDRTYHVTGSGESYYAHKNVEPFSEKTGFSKKDFEGALRTASRRQKQ